MADLYFILEPKGQKLSHVWKTGIQTTVKGVEQRAMFYTWPRINYALDLLATTTEEINYLKRKIFYYSDAVWGIPLWVDKTILTAQAASGQKTISVLETDYRHFYVGRQCIIIDPSSLSTYEVGVIASKTTNQIVLVSNLTLTWPAGSYILPLYDFRVTADQEIEAQIQKAQSVQLTAMESFEALRTFTYSLPSSGADTYESLDLFLLKMLVPVKYRYKRSYDLTQFLGLGYGSGNFDAGNNMLGISTSTVRPSRQDIWELLNFFDSKQGRFDKFWIPTWSKDIVVTGAVLNTDTILTIQPIQYSSYYLPNDVIGRYVYIQFPDGTYACRKINDATTSTITLDSAIGVTVAAEDLDDLLISFLILGRFDIDELELDYIKEGVVRSELSFAGLVGEDVS